MKKRKPIEVLAAEVIEELRRLNYAYNTVCGFRASFNRICAFAQEVSRTSLKILVTSI